MLSRNDNDVSGVLERLKRGAKLSASDVEAITRWALPHVECGLRRGLRGRTSIRAEDLLSDFILNKLLDRDFFPRIAEAPSASALLAKAARNFAIDARRKQEVTRSDPVTHGLRSRDSEGLTEDEQLSRRLHDHAEPSSGATIGFDEELEGATEEGIACREELDALSQDDRLFLAVYYIEHDELGDDQVAFLARRRNVSTDEVQNQLDARAERFRDLRAVVAEQRDTLFAEQISRWNRIDEVCEELDSRPGDLLDEAARLDQDRLAAIRKVRDLQPFSTSELMGYLAYLEERLRGTAARRNDAIEKARRGIPSGRPDMEEVGIILGEFLPDDDAKTRARKANTLWVRLRRLRKKLTDGAEQRLQS